MAGLAVLIHGMWGTAGVWHEWRPFLRDRGWDTIAHPLRYHHRSSEPSHPALGETSLLDYVADLETMILALPEVPVIVGHSMGGLLALMLCAKGLGRAGVLLTPAPPSGIVAIRPSNLLAFARTQARWGWWRKPHRPTLGEALCYTFNTAERALAIDEHEGFVHESGRALFEISLPWLDRSKAATVDPRSVTVPLLFVAAEKDRLVPPGVVRRTAKQFAHVSDYIEYDGQGHWVLGQPGWERIADHAETWLKGRAL